MERLAVAERSRERLLKALVVHASIDRGTDYRDTIVWCALPFLQARRLDIDPVALFDEAATFAGPAVATTLRATGRRTDITVASFHPSIEDTPDGPRPAGSTRPPSARCSRRWSPSAWRRWPPIFARST